MFWTFHINGFIQYHTIFCIWLHSLSTLFPKFFHVVACASILHFFWRLNNNPFVEYLGIYHFCLFISSTDGHLDCLHLLAIKNSAALTFKCKVLNGHRFSVLLGVYPRLELLSHVVTLFNLLRNCQTFSKVVAPFILLPAVYEGSNFSTSLSTLIIVHLFYYNNLVVSHYGCDLHLPHK